MLGILSSMYNTVACFSFNFGFVSVKLSNISTMLYSLACGSSIQNVLPLPKSLSTPQIPSMASVSFFTTARPSPVPSISLFSDPIRSKGVNNFGISIDLIPTPLSAIEMRITNVSLFVPDFSSVLIFTLPFSLLYFMALFIRFNKICFKLCRSAFTNSLFTGESISSK